MHRVLPFALCLPLAALAGCLLAEEDCGIGFAFVDDRCVPADPAPPFRAGDGAPTAPDARGAEPLDDAGPAPDPEPEPDDWAEYRIGLIVDRTALAAARETPASPGADIDAIQAIEASVRGDVRLGVASTVLGALFNDPFRGNLNDDPAAVLGAPDGVVASLGTNGGFVYVELDLERPLRQGDLLVIIERLEPGGQDDAYMLYLCRTPDSVDDCRALGDGLPGTTRFLLE